MKRPTKNQAEWLVIATFMVLGFTLSTYAHGIVYAVGQLLSTAVIVAILMGVITVARRIGR